MSTLAPIVLFVYNRPVHTQKTIHALQANKLASQSDLVIYSDAAKNANDKEGVGEVRKIIHAIEGFASIKVVEREKNAGLAESITVGVSDVIAQSGKVIVIEDDLVTSPYFLAFMNAALDRYVDDERVMCVNGYVLPDIQCEGPFFIRSPSSWGWATWQRSWKYFQRDASMFVSGFSVEQRHRFDFDSTFPFFRTIIRNHRRELNTWAIFWYATIFAQGGLCISPQQSLVINIGNDGSGTHARDVDSFQGELLDHLDMIFSDKIEENSLVIEQYKHFYRQCHRGLATRIYMSLLPVIRLIENRLL